MVLAAAAGVLGMLLAYWGIAALKILTPAFRAFLLAIQLLAKTLHKALIIRNKLAFPLRKMV